MADPNPEVAGAVQNNAGWIVAAFVGLWAWLMRKMLGRHFKAFDEIGKAVKSIDARLAHIEGRFKEQDKRRSRRHS